MTDREQRTREFLYQIFPQDHVDWIFGYGLPRSGRDGTIVVYFEGSYFESFNYSVLRPTTFRITNRNGGAQYHLPASLFMEDDGD